jgi:hypothetical protein
MGLGEVRKRCTGIPASVLIPAPVITMILRVNFIARAISERWRSETSRSELGSTTIHIFGIRRVVLVFSCGRFEDEKGYGGPALWKGLAQALYTQNSAAPLT